MNFEVCVVLFQIPLFFVDIAFLLPLLSGSKLFDLENWNLYNIKKESN